MLPLIVLLALGASAVGQQQPDGVAAMEEVMAASQRRAAQRAAHPASSTLLRGVAAANTKFEVPVVERSSAAPLAQKIVNGEYLSNVKSLDDDLMNSADAELADLKVLDAKPARSMTALTASKAQLHETTAQRAARFFAKHGMKKVSTMLANAQAQPPSPTATGGPVKR